MQSAAVTNPLNVLVVDDDSALIRTLADILRLHGYDPSTAQSGREGLAIAELHAPALALVDLRLPDMDGVELAARLHALSELTQVVVLTGNASVESAVAAMREQSIDYLVKPVQVDRLMQVISMAGERWQRRQAEFALADRARQQEAVAALGQRALAMMDIDVLFDEALATVARTLDVPVGRILEYKSDGQALAIRSSVGPIGESETAGLSAMAVPIPGAVRDVGRLEVFDAATRTFTRDDEFFLTAIAHVLGMTVERQRTERAFRQSQRLEAVGRLASGVAHDFNNMLSAITGYAEIVMQDLPTGDPHRDDLKEILTAAGRAAGLTRQLLAFSREQIMRPRVLSLNDVVSGMEKMIRRLLTSEIELVLRLDPDVAWTKADPGQLEQVLMNLCVNARDAMPNGGRLTIETMNTTLDRSRAHDLTLSNDAHGDYVMLAVTDTGIGMDAETRARIFEPFFTTKGPEKGTGLGLATVYGIVKQSAGELFVYSEPGHGSSFKIYLPQSEDSADPDERAPEPAQPSGGNETILVAEDEAVIRNIIERSLGKAGYSVIMAGDGEAALRALEANRVDVLLTDMIMPGMNGSELARRARALRPGLRVMFLSGYTAATATSGNVIGPDDFFLQKPFGTETLVSTLRQVLDRRSLR